MLVEAVRDILIRSGFCTSEAVHQWTSVFDVVARRDESLLFVKVYSNVDRLSSAGAEQLRGVAASLEGSPFVVGLRSSRIALETGVLYLRQGVPIMSLETLHEHLLEGVPPFVYAGPGGKYVNLDGETLAHTRVERGISLSDLAEAAGVSRRTISMYEHGMAAQVETAARLEEFLGIPIVFALDPFSNRPELEDHRLELAGLEGLEQDVFGRLEGLGYQVMPTTGCPFDAISSSKVSVLLTGVKAGTPNGITKVRARTMAEIARVAERDSVLFVERKLTKETIEGTPVIARQELVRIGNPEEILRLIHERGGKHC
jgi:putative transcriptional regulator